MPDVQLKIGSTAFRGWKSLTASLGIEQIAGAYELSVSDTALDGSAARDILPGKRAALSIGGQTIITGYIDDIEISHQGSEHSITVRGRDATGDLVDSAAVHKSGQWLDQGMLAIARDLVQPFGIRIRADTDLGKPFTTWNVEPGETVFENLDRMARHRGVLLVSDGQGGLLLTTAGQQRVGTALVLGENILAGNTTISHAQRFSEYTVLGQRPSDEQSTGQQITQKKSSATDAQIKRYRPTVEIIEDVGDAATYQKRADWKRSVSAGRGTRTSITVQGWSHESGLWKPNMLVSVTDRWLRLENRELLIVGVRYLLDMSGTRTELSLMPREGMTPEARAEVEETKA